MWRKASFLLVVVLSACTPTMGQEWATKMFEQTEHDFGNVARSALTEYRFVLSNIYLEDVHIASVRSSCGCTTPRIEKEWLKTYEKGAIVAHFNTDKFLGQKGATITVTFDKPYPAEVQLHARGYVRSDVVFNPGSIQLGTVEQGTAADTKVSLSYAGHSGWGITEVRSNNPHLSAEAIETGRSGGQVSYELRVHLDDGAPVGYLGDHLMLVTTDGPTRQIPAQVEGNVAPAVTVSPASLFMGSVEPGKTITKQLVVRGKRPFRILSIGCDDESFTFEKPDESAKALHIIPVTFVGGTDPGKVMRTIRIETDLGGSTPQLEAYAVVMVP